MMRIVAIALLPLLTQASLRIHAAPKAVPLVAKVDNKQVHLNVAENKKTMHFGCVSACEPSPIESKCATACEAEAYRCIDETGPNETPEDTKKCQDKVIANYQKTKGLPPAKEGNATKGNATKAKEEPKKAKMFLQVHNKSWNKSAAEEKQRQCCKRGKTCCNNPKGRQGKGKAFLQVKNIDDDNAEAAEMARLEAQSDKDMGEDDDESKTDDDEEKSDDEESFIQKSKNIDDDNAEAAEMARLEAQSDKDMGEDDDESKTDDDEDKSDDQE